MRRDVQEIFRNTPHGKQVMMFSATLSKEIRPVCKKFMQDVNTQTIRLLDLLLLPITTTSNNNKSSHAVVLLAIHKRAAVVVGALQLLLLLSTTGAIVGALLITAAVAPTALGASPLQAPIKKNNQLIVDRVKAV